MTLQQFDRWLLNAVERRQFKLKLADCIDEFGNSYGTNGSHFFVRALAAGEDDESVRSSLKTYYARNQARSFNQVVGRDIGDPAGGQYFCPWEADRIRPLAKFSLSHKAGPTSDEALERIVSRLGAILRSIRRDGYHESSFSNESPRVIELIDESNKRKFIIRDGQHRCAVLSHLGHEIIWACYEADYRMQSRAFMTLQRKFGRSQFTEMATPREVRESEVDSWPHVHAGRVTRDDALKFFHAVFDRATANGQPAKLNRC